MPNFEQYYLTPTMEQPQRLQTFGRTTALTQGQLSSPRFAAGEAGWNMDENGNVEFNDGNFRGDITGASGTFSGTITATAGAIGGFDIGSDYIRDAANSMGMASTVSGGDDVRFWAGDTFANRATADFRVTEAGALTATSATITGGDLTSSELNNDVVDTDQIVNLAVTNAKINDLAVDKLTAGTITSKAIVLAISAGTGDVQIRAGIASGDFDNTGAASGFILGIDDSDSDRAKFYIGDGTTFLEWDGTGLTIEGTVGGTLDATDLSGLVPLANENVAAQGWTYTGAFSASDNDTVAWATGTLTTAGGTAYSITGANTGNMTAITYIYLDIAVSTTAFQTTTTAATAVGSGKVLVAVAEDVASGKDAVFQVFSGQALGGSGKLITADDVVANTITTNEIAANTITAGNIAATTITATEMNVSQLSAIAADLGTITAGTVTGATLRTSASNPKFQMTSSAFQGLNSSGNVIFEVLLTGGDSGDVIMGDDATGQFAQWDDSAGTFTASGNVRPTLTIEAGENLTAGDAVVVKYRTIGMDFELSSSQYLSITDASQTGLDITDDISMEAWIKAESISGSHVIMAKADDSGSQIAYIFQVNSDGTLDLFVSDDGTVNSGHFQQYTTDDPQVSVDTFVHVAVTFDISAETCVFYVDGSSVASSQTGGTSLGAALKDSTAPFTIGARIVAGSPGNFFDGVIDDARIWSDLRTGVEISDNYDGELTGSETGLAGYWKFTEDILDETSNNNDLTNNNSAQFGEGASVLATGNNVVILGDADSAVRINFVGFVESDVTSGSDASVVLAGVVSGLSSIEVGANYYLSGTAGALSRSAGTNERKVAIGISTTEILITNIW